MMIHHWIILITKLFVTLHYSEIDWLIRIRKNSPNLMMIFIINNFLCFCLMINSLLIDNHLLMTMCLGEENRLIFFLFCSEENGYDDDFWNEMFAIFVIWALIKQNNKQKQQNDDYYYYRQKKFSSSNIKHMSHHHHHQKKNI